MKYKDRKKVLSDTSECYIIVTKKKKDNIPYIKIKNISCIFSKNHVTNPELIFWDI